ncbi:hypothetical protein QYS49_34295 [Marivirga salinae]|uniref:Uncharacterized protein n=1 Tax=Marivirga salinarum TaxID=3059078 RepID=A0AA51NCM0_9BACT|nr:hypothetical protein [Marivirga sp. BDSF4-3]WMN12688.1 hypothetical protein QYS49_34295 [Marivirga sp. BDSF4-3]
MFKYSNEYKVRQFAAMINFPKLDKIKKKGVNENDYLELLSFFGKRTITNPFELNNISH